MSILNPAIPRGGGGGSFWCNLHHLKVASDPGKQKSILISIEIRESHLKLLFHSTCNIRTTHLFFLGTS